MTVDLKGQLRELCAVVDDEQGPVSVEDLVARTELIVRAEPRPMSMPPIRRQWMVVVSAAAFAIAVALPLLVLSNTSEPSTAQAWVRVADNELSFQDGWMSAVTTGGPGLVAVGSVADESAVWTSVDGTAWSRVPHDPAVFGKEDIESVLWNVTAAGPGLVAVGSAENHVAAVWTSVDGQTWSRVPHDDAIFPQGWITSVTVGGPGLVAVGGLDPGAAVWTSVDGLTWSRVPHDDAVLGEGVMNSVTAGGPGLVAVGRDDGNDAAVWTSVDGLTWSRVHHDQEVFGNGGMLSVTAGGPGLVAVGNGDGHVGSSAPIWTSPDGVTWTRVVRNDASFAYMGGYTLNDVISGGPGLVAVGLANPLLAEPNAAAWRSINGLEWSRVPNDELIFSEAGISSVTAGPLGLVAVGADSAGAAVWVTHD